MTLNNNSKTTIANEAADFEIGIEDDACPNKKTHFYQFKEYDLLMKLIETLSSNVKVLREKEKAYQQFLFICDTYQEQPHLIDPFLMEIFDKLIKLVKDCIKQEQNEHNKSIIDESFKYMHCLTKMRGFKKIIQYLPHENVDFEPVLNLLARQNMNDVYNWQTRYMLLVWISIVCMVPFDLKKFDALGENKENKIMNRMLDVCIPYLFSSDKCQDASSYVLAKFMSRPDLKNVVLPNFFEQLFKFMEEEKKSGNNIKLLGTLKCLANIFKYGKREELLKYTLPSLKNMIENDLLSSSQLALVRKFHIKIVQRIGITFLKAKIANWRYERGSRVLMEKLNKVNGHNSDDKKIESSNLEESINEEIIPNEIEEIIEQLLLGLKDTDTIVRWSSAKGIGRITNRLPKEMAEDVLSSILDLFTFVEDDSAWHGGCLAIAELGRRGLLLPHQLLFVVPIILKALVFDKKMGNYSLGRNVRDAACYVCWSLARAFEPKVIAPFVNEIASALLIVTVFDREVNCRRAASASFQENVGRQGQFPHGIDILTKCDYYAVGQLQNCYLNLSVFIAEFDEYRQTLIDHLLEYKFNHWDQSIRELTSKALFKLTPSCPEYMAFSVIPNLLKHALSIDLNTRHGSLICLAELIHALSEHLKVINFDTDLENTKTENSIKKSKSYFFSDTIVELKNIILKIFDQKYFKGSGGEYLRPAVCFFIRKLSISNLFRIRLNKVNSETSQNNQDFELDENFINECESFLKQCIEYNKENVQLASVETIEYYCHLKYLESDKESQSKMIEAYLHSLKTTSKEYVRSGYCLALGSLPSSLISQNENFENIINVLIESSKTISGPIVSEENSKNTIPTVSAVGTVLTYKNQDNSAGWVQARRDSIKAITKLFKLVKTKQDLSLYNLNTKFILKIFDCFLDGLNDYSIDSKGDSGSKIRECSIEALETLIELCAKHEIAEIINNKLLMIKIFGGIMQQAVERIDRTRNLAGKTFANLLHNKYLKLENFENIISIRKIFKKHECFLMDWNVALSTLPLFVKLLKIREFQIYLLTGFVYSIGSLTESLVKSATNSFLKELHLLNSNQDTKEEFDEILKKLLSLCRTHLRNDKLSASLIKTVDLIIQNALLNDEKIVVEFLNSFLDNVKVTKDMQKLCSYVDLFSDMLQFEGERIRERSMIQLSIMLCHQYPRIRKTTASKLFEALINYPNIFENEEENDECINLLSETNWDQPMEIIRPIRNRICDLTKTPKPVLIKKNTT